MTSATQIAQVIEQLARFTHEEGRTSDLTSAQWSALRYFARAALTSRTVSAFADYHRTTRGTASQTVKSLVVKGFLERTPSPSDRRTVYIDLTELGYEAWQNDPFEKLTNAVAALPAGQQLSLTEILLPLMQHMAEELNVRCFGTCGSCRYLKISAALGNEDTTYFCREHKAPMSKLDIDAICMHYKPKVAFG